MPDYFRGVARPLDLIGPVVTAPPFTFALALVIAATVVAIRANIALGAHRDLAVSRMRSSWGEARYAPERRALGATSVVTALAFMAEFVASAYLPSETPAIAWRFATPLVCAAVGLAAVLAVIVLRGSGAPERPMTPTERRTWLTFSSRTSLIAAASSALVLATTTIAAGLASSANAEGEFVWLVIPIPNAASVDPIRIPFYGWAYGLPVLIGLAALLIATGITLRRSAARPFLRPETVTVERAARRRTARDAALISTSATLLTLAMSWRLVARGGSVDSLIIDGQNGGAPFDVAWRYAEFAIIAGWAAPALEVVALAILFLVAVSALRIGGVSSESAPALDAGAEITR